MFKDYFDFIYLNSQLTADQAYQVARECWFKGLDKLEALRIARMAANHFNAMKEALK